MTGQRVLGLDPGTKRIGVALSDALGIIAQPHSVIDVEQAEPAEVVRNLVAEHDVSLVVIGLPVSLSGDEGPSAVAVRAFAGDLARDVGCEVELMDERFTTVIAEQALLEGRVRRSGRREARDKVAAAVMLQGYLDRRRQGSS
ncbi:MAG: Holliday junction resolvase RuvX [Acidimicrobiia bacterium]